MRVFSTRLRRPVRQGGCLDWVCERIHKPLILSRSFLGSYQIQRTRERVLKADKEQDRKDEKPNFVYARAVNKTALKFFLSRPRIFSHIVSTAWKWEVMGRNKATSYSLFATAVFASFSRARTCFADMMQGSCCGCKWSQQSSKPEFNWCYHKALTIWSSQSKIYFMID